MHHSAETLLDLNYIPDPFFSNLIPDANDDVVWEAIQADLREHYPTTAVDTLCVVLLAAARARRNKSYDRASVLRLRKEIPAYDRHLLADRYLNRLTLRDCADSRGLRIKALAALIAVAERAAQSATVATVATVSSLS